MKKIKFATTLTKEKSTRDCLDPWFFVHFQATRAVRPCCWHPPIGTLPPGGSLDEVLNNEAIRELRRQLLEGDLNEHCRVCPARGVTEPAALRERVREELAYEIERIAENPL